MDEKYVVDRFNAVAGHADDPLDEPALVRRGKEDDNLAAPGIVPLRQMPGGEGHLQVVGQLVHENAVALHNGGLHGAGGHIVPIRDGGADGEHDDEHDEERLGFVAQEFDPLLFLGVVLHVGWRGLGLRLFNMEIASIIAFQSDSVFRRSRPRAWWAKPWRWWRRSCSSTR